MTIWTEKKTKPSSKNVRDWLFGSQPMEIRATTVIKTLAPFYNRNTSQNSTSQKVSHKNFRSLRQETRLKGGQKFAFLAPTRPLLADKQKQKQSQNKTLAAD